MSYKSSCRACDHNHDGYICNWQVSKQGRITLRPTYSEGLWGISSALHKHVKDDEGKDVVSPFTISAWKDELFDYVQETDCGCKLYIPSENLEYLEWKYEQRE